MNSDGENEEHILLSPDASPAAGEDISISKPSLKSITLKRRAYTQVEFDEIYPDITAPVSLKHRLKSACSCTKSRVLSTLLSFFPIINAIRHYRIRQYIVDDIISGLSVAFLHLPQGLGFGLLASLAPINGLYCSFFPVILGTLFGTSHHASLGTNAVIALLTAEVVEQEADTLQASVANSTFTGDEILDYKVGVAMAASFIAGIILFAMGVLRLGFITMYLSVSFVGGFTTASAVHIATSQVSKALNIQLKGWSGAGKIVLIYIDIFTNITKTNIADLIIALISIAILLAVKIGINERFAKRMKVPVPIDLLVVVFGTIISHFAGLHDKYGIAIAGDVPAGLPVPRLPNLEVVPNIASQCFVIAIIVFAMTISLAKLMAKVHDYDIDDNQELIAYGISNFGSSFFRSFPACAAPPRVMILSSLRAKTVLNGIPTAIFMLIVLLAAGQLFVSLPIAVLAAMIIVAMKNLLLQLRQLPQIWRTSKADFAVWLSTFLVGVFVDLVYGIMAGIGVSVLAVVVHTQLASGTVSNMAVKEDVIIKERQNKVNKETPGVTVFYFNSMLFFANAEKFKSEMYEKVFHPAVREKMKKEILVKSSTDTAGADLKDVVISDNLDTHHIIIDCSSISFIDIAGINVLKTVISKYKKVDTTVYLANCRNYMLKTLENSDFYDNFPKDNVFYDVWDAVAATESNVVVSETNGK